MQIIQLTLPVVCSIKILVEQAHLQNEIIKKLSIFNIAQLKYCLKETKSEIYRIYLLVNVIVIIYYAFYKIFFDSFDV